MVVYPIPISVCTYIVRRCDSSPPQDTSSQAIPRFYFPGGRPVPVEVRAAVHAAMQRVVDQHPDGLPILALRSLLRDVYELPTYLAYPLFFKLVQPGESAVRPRALLDWCESHNLMGIPVVQRVFAILRGDPSRAYLVHDDFRSMMNGILLNHPGLEFLQETPEFQERYCVRGDVMMVVGKLCRPEHGYCYPLRTQPFVMLRVPSAPGTAALVFLHLYCCTHTAAPTLPCAQVCRDSHPAHLLHAQPCRQRPPDAEGVAAR